jgi:hypothetical protein
MGSLALCSISSHASEVLIANKATTVAKIDEVRLLERSRAYSEKKGWKCSILKCGRIIFFMDRVGSNCVAVELLVEATVYSNGKPAVDRYSTVLWFDEKGDVYENAEPVGFENSVIPGNPMSFSSAVATTPTTRSDQPR